MSSLTTSTLSKFTMSVRRTGRRSVVVAVLLQPLLLFLFLFMSLVALGEAKTYDRCQLASDLLHKYKLPANQISQWICLVRWESEFNTSAIGSLNADGSLDHGLFQISDLYWCSGPRLDEGACGVSCDQLRDDDIKDDVKCVKRIFRQSQHLSGNGFNAWVAWRQHCQGETDSYVADCPDLLLLPPPPQRIVNQWQHPPPAPPSTGFFNAPSMLLQSWFLP